MRVVDTCLVNHIKLCGALALALLPQIAQAAPRVEAPTGEYIGVDARRSARLIELVSARTDGAPLVLRAAATPAASDPALELWRVEASIDGIPLARPLARALVDGRDGGRVALLVRAGDAAVTSVGPLRASTPRLDAAGALELVARSGQPGSRGATVAELVVIPGASESRLAWRVDPPADLTALTNPVFHVDDATGELRRVHERLRFADVRAFQVNPLATPTAEVYPLHELNDMTQFLEGPRFRARNCVAPMSGSGTCSAVQIAEADMNGDFLYPAPTIGDPEEEGQYGEPFSEVAAYFHADRMYAWLDGLGVAYLPCHDNDETATITANFSSYVDGEPQPLFNAFYTGQCSSTVFMGQAERDLALDGDVVYHEFGHGIVDRQSGGGLAIARPFQHAVNNDAGSINEGFADFVSSVFTGDSLMAEYSFDDGARDADNAFLCPRDLVGEIHADGELFSGAAWEAYEVLGDDFFVAVVDSLAMMNVDVTFEEASAAVIATTELALGPDAGATVSEIFDARGLVDCERIADLDELGAGGQHPGLPPNSMIVWPSVGFSLPGFAPFRPAPVQWRIEFPEGMDTALITYDVVQAFTDELAPVEDATLGAHIRKNNPVTFNYATQGDSVFSVTAKTDELLMNAEEGSIELTAEPGETYYVSLAHFAGLDLPAITNIEIVFDGPGPQGTTTEGTTSDGSTGGESTTGPGATTAGQDADTDAESSDPASGTGGGTEGGDEPDGGCGCQAAPTPAPALAGSLALLGLVWSRRRRA